MYQIIIDSGTGITFDNLPPDVISLVTGINELANNSLQLSFMYSEATERAKERLQNVAGPLDFSRDRAGDYLCSRLVQQQRAPLTLPGVDTLTGRRLRPTTDEEIRTAARESGWDNAYNQHQRPNDVIVGVDMGAPRPIGATYQYQAVVTGGGGDGGGGVGGGVGGGGGVGVGVGGGGGVGGGVGGGGGVGAPAGRFPDAFVHTAPTPPAPVAEAVERLTRINIDNIVEPQIGEEEEEEVNGTGIVPVANYVLPGEVPTEQVPVEIAKTLRNNVSTQAGMVSSKLAELEKIMRRSLIIQNEINLLMKPVVENEKVQRVKAQIDQLSAYGGDIKKVYIAADTGDLIILTNRLRSDPITDDRGRTQIFDIGEMQINLSLMLLLCETDPGSTAGRPVKIKNLTHQYCINNGNGNSKWECGHVREGEICFGNVFAQIHQALIAKNIILVVELIIRFIKNPDPNDAWGSKILNFPKVGGGV